MTTASSFADCAAIIAELRGSLLELEQATNQLQLEGLASREWFQLLEQKLIPQISDSAYLVAAVCGGTNIGKSVVFNHVAGTKASAVTPLASGTKHPVCLVPRRFTETHDLNSIFPGFELRSWERSEAALEESASSLLFWRSDDSLPTNLLVLDSPDIDSDARVNWERADMIRRAADVLIAVLTQQKYNDASVKEFFRRAAAEDKVVLLVVNQVHLPDDEPYWPLWLKTFCNETGIRPQAVYLTPHDRAAANENRLPFFERNWPVAAEPATEPIVHGPRRLHEDLSALRFGEIKLRTLGRSLQLLLEPFAVDGYLAEVRTRSHEFQTAGELLSTHKLAEVENWPSVPNSLLVNKIRAWWQSQRSGWSATVHGFYNRVGEGLTKGYKLVYEKLTGPQAPPWKLYREREWDAVLRVVDDVYQRLNWFLELGNPLLQPRLAALLGATSRSDLIQTLRAQHEACNLEDEIERLIADELEAFRLESPQWYQSLKHLDSIAAAARPVTSIALFVTGFGPVGHAVGQIAANAAVTSAVHVASDVVAGSLTAAVGENWISHGASAGAGWLEAHFRRIHESFAARRAAWLAELLQIHLLGSLPHDLQAAALIPESHEFLRATTALAQLHEFVTREVSTPKAEISAS